VSGLSLGRRGQRLVEAPGDNRKVYGFGLVDWRDGWFDGRVAPGRTAEVFCDQVRAAVARSKRRERIALVMTDNLKTHTSAGSLLVRSMLTELKEHLYLVYTPAYDPDANRIEWHGPRLATGRDTQSSPQRFRTPACGCGDSFSGTRTNSRRGASSYRQSICTRQGSKCSSATCSGRIINLEAFSSSGKLPVVEIRVFSITCQQFFVSAALGNLSFVYDDDFGGVADSRETVRNDE
jgi:hypothetical protein